MRICIVQIRSGSWVERAGHEALAVMFPRLLDTIPKILLVDITRRLCLQPPLVSQLLPSSNVGLLTACCGITLRACRVHATTPLVTWGCTRSERVTCE